MYQLVFLSLEVLSNETWRDRVPSSVYQKNVLALDVIDEFYQRACHVTLGSNVVKFHSALERKPCTSYQTYISAPFPPRMRTRKNTDGLRHSSGYTQWYREYRES